MATCPCRQALVREQFNMLLLNQEAAIASLPSMLPPDAETQRTAFGLIKQVLAARGEMSAQDRNRLNEVGRLFGVDEDGSASSIPFRRIRKEPQVQAS